MHFPHYVRHEALGFICTIILNEIFCNRMKYLSMQAELAKLTSVTQGETAWLAQSHLNLFHIVCFGF